LVPTWLMAGIGLLTGQGFVPLQGADNQKSSASSNSAEQNQDQKNHNHKT
jgi:hypothetical protein